MGIRKGKKTKRQPTPFLITDRSNAIVPRLFNFFGEQWREPPKDALDTMVLTAFDLRKCDEYEQVRVVPR